jgi:hypothetical protein
VCQDKTLIAQKAASVLTILPTVLFVGITGSLAMSNSDNTSDIDLIVITRKNTLWATRLVGWSLLKIKGFGIRTRDSKVSEDLLCMNIWLDEATLLWQKRNVFTAHEIAQIVPIINKLGTYEKFIAKNKWIRNYWPNAVQGITTNNKVQRGILVSVLCSMFFVLCSIVDPLAYALQKMYMRGKISIEIIEKHRAVFHPVDLSDKIVRALGEKLKTS